MNVDVAIIGVGTAGMVAYRAARMHTDRIVTIESGPYGTMCARVGCMPSKLLIAAAEVAHMIDIAPAFGITPRKVDINGEELMRRLREERDRFVAGVVESVDFWPPEHRLRGRAHFLAPDTLIVDDEVQVKAQRIILATGSSPVVPEAWRHALGERLIVSDDVFEWRKLPESVAVVGAGVIGLEIAQALVRLGVRVRLFNRGERVGPLTDPEVVAIARDIVNHAIPTVWRADIDTVETCGDGVRVGYRADGQRCEETFELLLAAIGRRPALASLDLDAAGIELDSRGLPPFDPATGQIGNLPIFIAGDVNALHPLLHEAANDGRIAGENAGRFPDVRSWPRCAPLNVVFTEPQIMLAGQRFADLQRAGSDFAVGVVSFEDQGRSRIIGANTGLLRIYGERGSRRFLGAEMIGPAAEHLGHLLAWCVQQGVTVDDMYASPFYHPTVEEGLRSALQVLRRDLRR